MTAAERQARRRRNLVDRRPVLELLVDLAEADEVLAALRRADPPDANSVWHAETRCLQIKGDIAVTLGVGVMWPRRQLRKRQRAARGLDW